MLVLKYMSQRKKCVPSYIHTQQRLKSACASAQSVQSLLIQHEKNVESLAILNMPSEDSDQAVHVHMLI